MTINQTYKWTGKFTPFDHQKVTSSFLVDNPKAFCFNEQGCVDADTEYLSPTGWVKISDYKGGEVMQFDPDDLWSAKFVTPTKYVKIPCASMVRIKTKYGLDQLLSPEHRVLLVDGKNPSKREVCSAEEVLKRHNAYHNGKRVKNGGTKGGTDTIAFSAMAIPTASSFHGGPGFALQKRFLRLQIAVIADGYFGSDTTWCVIRLKKERKILRLRELLKATKIDYEETKPEYTSAPGFHVFKFYAPRRDKEFTDFYWAANSYQLDTIADEVLRWDGCTTRGARFSTTSKASADFVQYVFSSVSKTARVTSNRRKGRKSREYNVQIREHKHLYLRGSGTTVRRAKSTDGFKYCFMVPSTFLVFRRNGCVFISGNTGKTASVIWAADFLLKQKEIKRVLVICPLSIMKSAWQRDLFTFAMHRSVSVAHGDAKTRAKVIRSGSEFVVINFDGVGVVKEEILQGGFDLIVVDECNAYKNAQTARWKILKDIVLKTDPKLWMLTGTPAAQSPLDAYGLAKLVNPLNTPKYYGQFRDQVMYKVTQFKYMPKSCAQNVVHNVLQPAIRFERDQCLDLPEVTYAEREAPMTPQQRKYYNTLRTQLLFEADDEEVSAVNAAVKINKLLQIAGGAVYTDMGEVLEFDVSNQVQAVLETIEESAHKTLIFVPFTHTIDLLKTYLEKSGVSCGIIRGDVSLNNRTNLINDFQTTPNPEAMIIQPQAASHGVTLTAADNIIWYAPVTSVETYLQANARINRPGQKHPMLITHICGSPVEERLYSMLRNNIADHGKIISLYRKVQSDTP